MLRSMFSGVSGLRTHQVMMDVIGNNIANVNTIGFKASTAVFQDLLTQTVAGAGAPTAANGGINPTQVGLGVRLAGTSMSFSQGASQTTGRVTDLAIQGDGFFIVRRANQELYTRAGAFSFDPLGRLTSPDGLVLQGWTATAAGVVNTGIEPTDLVLPLGQTIAPSRTTQVSIGGNLDSAASVGTIVTTSITIYDDQGNASTATFKFEKLSAPGANPSWRLTASDDAGNNATFGGNPDVTLDFDPATGQLVAPPGAMVLDGITVNVDVGTPGSPLAITGYAGESNVAATSQDGSPLGVLESFRIGPDGVVTGVFSNGRNRTIGQVAIAVFANPAGLEALGSSVYQDTVNSGAPQVGTPGTANRGLLASSALEMSNVDLAREFTNLILAQRGFQANSRVISASDELLQDLVNLKR